MVGARPGWRSGLRIAPRAWAQCYLWCFSRPLLYIIKPINYFNGFLELLPVHCTPPPYSQPMSNVNDRADLLSFESGVSRYFHSTLLSECMRLRELFPSVSLP